MEKQMAKNIRKGSVWLHRHGGSIIAVLRIHERRIKILERKLKPKGHRKDTWNEKCDYRGCNKKRTFECGTNVYGQIGGWCSKKHFNSF